MAGNVKITQLPVVATMTDSTIVPVVAAGVLAGEIYYDNGGTVRVVLP
jgi:hypothetical protein